MSAEYFAHLKMEKGQEVPTRFGFLSKPFPANATGTRFYNAFKKWLLDNAQTIVNDPDLQYLSNRQLIMMWRNVKTMKVTNLSPADIETLGLFLFNDPNFNFAQ